MTDVQDGANIRKECYFKVLFLTKFSPVRPPCISCLGVKVKSPGIEANVPREGCRMVSLKVGDAANYCPYSAMPTIAKSSLV